MGQSRSDDLVAALDPDDPAFIADPYPALGALREATPLAVDAVGDHLVTRFDDVHRLLRDRRLGRVFHHRYRRCELGLDEPAHRWTRFEDHERWSLLSLEPPDHTRLRRLVSKAFSPSSVADSGAEVRLLAEGFVDAVAELDRFDLLSQVAQPYSVAVICQLLGVPTADTEQLLAWSHAIVKMYELNAGFEQEQAAERAAGEFIDYTEELLAAKRRRPDDGLVSRLVAVEDGGDTLTDAEIVSTTMVLLEAGHEATVNTLGNGIRALLSHPDEWRRLCEGQVRSRSAIEEMVRWDAPLHRFDRWVLDEGVTVGDTEIPIGTRLGLLFGSANRDPRRFDDPDRFDAGRDEPAHIGYGAGVHLCLGRHLARLELDTMLDTLVRRLPTLEIAEPPEYHPTFVIRGLRALVLAPR